MWFAHLAKEGEQMSIIDKEATIKLAAGTLTRGIMWAAGAVAAQVGVDTVSEDTATGLAAFVVSLIAAGAAFLWSKKKDKTLAES